MAQYVETQPRGPWFESACRGSCALGKALYWVSQKKWNGGFSVPCDLKVSYSFTWLNRASSAEENDTKIIEFGWVILILYPFHERQSFSNFDWFLRPMSEALCREWPFIRCFGVAHWSVLTKEMCRQKKGECDIVQINGLHQNTIWKAFHQNTIWKAFPDTILRSSVAKIKQNLKMTVFRISRNGNRFKITQPNSMILVSLSSVKDALTSDVK